MKKEEMFIGLADQNINNFEPEYIDVRLNFNDIDSILFQRTPDVNDRPKLELYYNRLPKDEYNNTIPVHMYGFVIPGDIHKKIEKKSVMINIVNECGELMSAHNVIFNPAIKEYRGELIEFDCTIYKYKSQQKYGIRIITESIQTVPTTICDVRSSWCMLGYPSRKIKVQEVINYYLAREDRYYQLMIRNAERILDRMSEIMFGISGLIYPAVLNMYSMRDDVINDLRFIYMNHKHINILLTVVVDYLIWLKPASYLDMIRIVSYIVLNYMGGCVDDPCSHKYRNCLSLTSRMLEVKTEHMAFNIMNIIKNCGGLKPISDIIPESFKINPDTIVENGRIQFAQRILQDIPEDRIQYFVRLD